MEPPMETTEPVPTVPIERYAIGNAAKARLGKHALQLLQKPGGSLRLLKGLLRFKTLNSVFKFVLEQNPDMPRLPRGVRPADEDAILATWAVINPELAAAMKKEEISPRRWLSAYGYLNSDGSADLWPLVEPKLYEVEKRIADLASGAAEYARPSITDQLTQDFPAAFNHHYKTYWSTDIDPALHYTHEVKSVKSGVQKHIYEVPSLRIFVMCESLELAWKIYKTRLLQEVRDKRITLLIDQPITHDSIWNSLAWLPEDISKSRVDPSLPNTSETHRFMAKLAAESKKTAEAHQQKK
jgi:hypothetical protein